MMRFACERCGKRYAAHHIVPVPGRVYRLKCKGCGHVISVNGSDALRAGDAQAATPGAAGPGAVDSTPPAAASASAFLDTLHLPDPEPEPQAGGGPEPAVPGPQGRDPFAFESIVERWPVEVTGSRPLVGGSPDPSGATPPAADGAPQAPEQDASTAARSNSAPGQEERESRKPATPAPPRRSSRAPVVALAIVLLAGAGFLAWQYLPRASVPAQGGEAVTGGPAAPGAATAAQAPPAPAPAEPAPAAPAAPDAAAAAPQPAGDTAPPTAEPAAEAGTPVPEPAPNPAPAPVPAKRAAPTPTRPAATAARPAPKPSQPKLARAEPPAPAAKPGAPSANAPAKSTTAPAPTAAPPPQPSPAAPPAQEPPAPAASPAAAPPQRDPDDAAEPPPVERLTPEAINRVLAGGRKAFDACLRNPSRGLDQPLGARQVTLRFTVAPEGSVGYPTIDDVAVSSAQVGQCLKAAARNLRFPAFKGDPVSVDQPVAIPAK